MKKLLLLLFVVLSFSACKKDAEPDPDYTEGLTGVYVVSYVRMNSMAVTLPLKNMSAKIDVVKKDLKTVSMQMAVTEDGRQNIYDFGDVELKPGSSSEFEIWQDGEKFGTLSKNSLFMKFDDGDKVEIRAGR